MCLFIGLPPVCIAEHNDVSSVLTQIGFSFVFGVYFEIKP